MCCIEYRARYILYKRLELTDTLASLTVYLYHFENGSNRFFVHTRVFRSVATEVKNFHVQLVMVFISPALDCGDGRHEHKCLVQSG